MFVFANVRGSFLYFENYLGARLLCFDRHQWISGTP
jgi:hypothetical protein